MPIPAQGIVVLSPRKTQVRMVYQLVGTEISQRVYTPKEHSQLRRILTSDHAMAKRAIRSNLDAFEGVVSATRYIS